MSPSLQQDLKQKKPFRSVQQEAYLSVVRTSTLLTDAMEDLVKARGISATQYNVLRILRGSGAEGLCRNALRDRMLTRMPDMTRLLDRMEEAGLVVRVREGEDRRMVLTAAARRARRTSDGAAPEADGRADRRAAPLAVRSADAGSRRRVSFLRHNKCCHTEQ